MTGLASVSTATLLSTDGGAYAAERAAALSGVPRSTVHYWARNGILVPSVSPEKLRLWSFSDLLRLRIIYWLRQPKTLAEGHEIPPSAMTKVRSALGQLTALGLDILDAEGKARILVTRDGHVYIRNREDLVLDGHQPGQLVLDLTGQFEPPSLKGIRGPDLLRPRPDLRIVPRKLAGSPHVVGTRIETTALAALDQRGFTEEQVLRLYPFVSLDAIHQAVELEAQLQANLVA